MCTCERCLRDRAYAAQQRAEFGDLAERSLQRIPNLGVQTTRGSMPRGAAWSDGLDTPLRLTISDAAQRVLDDLSATERSDLDIPRLVWERYLSEKPVPELEVEGPLTAEVAARIRALFGGDLDADDDTPDDDRVQLLTANAAIQDFARDLHARLDAFPAAEALKPLAAHWEALQDLLGALHTELGGRRNMGAYPASFARVSDLVLALSARLHLLLGRVALDNRPMEEKTEKTEKTHDGEA